MKGKKAWMVVALVWMIAIFCFTQLPYFTGENTSNAIHQVVVKEHQTIHTPSADRVDIGFLNLVVRKSTHVLVFGTLAFLLFQALKRFRYAYFLAWFGTFLYAITDEYHQSFMPGRVAAFQDVLFDSFGALLVLFVVFFIYRRKKFI
ncbi:VanZ family protein [Neobacillus jeddahensis]|uniref:VanZ family protein n=1 Tax=Neobacillus jeddahensis TaxID=1461580 RepID=UPI00058BD525|nr:VanZ family protein [Neobacillus jeddahensis]